METVDEPTRHWTIKLHVEQPEPDLWCVTCSELPLFHVVGETEQNARENVRILLKKYLELNFSVVVNRIEFADEVGTLEPAILPSYMIAEVAKISGQSLRP